MAEPAMSDEDELKKLHEAALALGIAVAADLDVLQWEPILDDTRTMPASYLVTYEAQGARWWSILSPREGYGLEAVLNTPLLAGGDVSFIAITRLARNPAHS